MPAITVHSNGANQRFDNWQYRIIDGVIEVINTDNSLSDWCYPGKKLERQIRLHMKRKNEKSLFVTLKMPYGSK